MIVLFVIDKRIDRLVFENIFSYLSSMTYFAPILSTEEYICIIHKATEKVIEINIFETVLENVILFSIKFVVWNFFQNSGSPEGGSMLEIAIFLSMSVN